MIDLNTLSKAMEIENPFLITSCKLVKNAENKLILKVTVKFNTDVDIIYKDTVLQIHDYVMDSWYHLPFFGKECLIQCKIPRVKQKKGEPKQIPVPWEWSNTRSIEDYIYENGVLKALKVDFRFMSI
jgi:hypothetical protein